MLTLFNTRTARLLLAVIIILSLTSVAATKVLYQTSIEAVVNAPRIEIEAPTDGVLSDLAIAPGSTVKSGAHLLNIRRDQFSRGTQDELGVREQTLRDRATALESQIMSLRAIRDTLHLRVSAYRAATVTQLAAASGAADAKAVDRAQTLERAIALRSANGTTVADVESARAEATIAKYDAESARAALKAAERGIITAQGAQDVPYSQQRVDELAVQITNLLAEFTLVNDELHEIERTTTTASPDSSLNGTIPIRATVDGVVWAASHSVGAHVTKGTSLITLIDCSQLYLDATISPRHHDKIEPGAAVRLRFAGTAHEFAGTVSYVRGGGVRDETGSAARLTLDNRRNDSHAIIDIDEKAIGALPGNFCQVGRSAKVIFDGPDFSQEKLQTASLTGRLLSFIKR